MCQKTLLFILTGNHGFDDFIHILLHLYGLHTSRLVELANLVEFLGELQDARFHHRGGVQVQVCSPLVLRGDIEQTAHKNPGAPVCPFCKLVLQPGGRKHLTIQALFVG